MKKIDSKYFGEVEYQDDDVLTFPVGLFGFEDEKDFLMLPFAGSQESMFSMQSIQTPGLAFIAMDPFSLDHTYEPVLQQEELKALGVEDREQLSYYVLCAVKSPVSESTVNLRCPVVVNPQNGLARQVILEGDRYEMRHPLAQFHGGRDSSC